MNQETNGTNTNGEVNSTAETLTGKEKRQENLKRYCDLTPEQKHELAVKGGKARAEQKRQRKTMREQLIAFLDTKASRDLATKYLGEDAEKIPDDELTMQSVMVARMWQEAAKKGNAKAAEFVRDTSGQKPKEEIAVDVNNTITDADRELIANMNDLLRQNLGK